jgi:hypothetical protein
MHFQHITQTRSVHNLGLGSTDNGFWEILLIKIQITMPVYTVVKTFQVESVCYIFLHFTVVNLKYGTIGRYHLMYLMIVTMNSNQSLSVAFILMSVYRKLLSRV